MNAYISPQYAQSLLDGWDGHDPIFQIRLYRMDIETGKRTSKLIIISHYNLSIIANNWILNGFQVDDHQKRK